MKLIANMICRKRIKVQFRIRRWIMNKVRAAKNIAGDPAHELNRVSFLPECKRVSDLDKVVVKLKRLCFKRLHSRRERVERRPGTGRTL